MAYTPKTLAEIPSSTNYVLTLQADRCNPEIVLTYRFVELFVASVRTFLGGHHVIETGPFHCTLKAIDPRESV